jgi:hypothetical protein
LVRRKKTAPIAHTIAKPTENSPSPVTSSAMVWVLAWEGGSFSADDAAEGVADEDVVGVAFDVDSLRVRVIACETLQAAVVVVVVGSRAAADTVTLPCIQG